MRTLGVVLGLLAAVGIVLTLAGRQVERRMNRVHAVAAEPPSERAGALHASALVADLHADPLLWGRDLAMRSTIGHVDLPRLRAGGVGLQVFGIVTKFPVTAGIERTDPRWPDAITLLALTQGWPLDTWTSLTARVLHQAARFDTLARGSAGQFRAVRTRADLDAALADHERDPRVIAGVLAIEGAHALDDDVGNLGRVYDAGVRVLGLAHFFDNAFAGSAHGLVKGGLTPQGRALVAEMERRGVIVDLAHASAATIADTLALATRPLVVSHTGVRGTCDNARNLSDEQVRAIAAAGGVIGIGVWETAVCGTAPDDVARAMAHVVGLVGDTHVALGTDFDGAVVTGFDATGLPRVTDALLRLGLEEEAIRRILGGNVVRVLRATLPRD
jgi:microsomal dipeptidase-like Zn-dependent dipeptidase